MKELSKLVPECEVRARSFLHMLGAAGIAYYVNETLRTKETQLAYYAQGRKPLAVVNALRKAAGLPEIGEDDNKATITKCDGEKIPSPHQSGRALDVYPVQGGRILWSVTEATADLWKQMGSIAESARLEWGGRWTPLDRYWVGWDAPHYQLPKDDA